MNWFPDPWQYLDFTDKARSMLACSLFFKYCPSIYLFILKWLILTLFSDIRYRWKRTIRRVTTPSVYLPFVVWGRGGYLVWDLTVPFVPNSMGLIVLCPVKLQNTTLLVVLWANEHFTSYVFFFILRKPKQHSRENRPSTTHSVSYRTTAYSKARAYHKTHSTSCQVRFLFSFILSFCSFSSHGC